MSIHDDKMNDIWDTNYLAGEYEIIVKDLIFQDLGHLIEGMEIKDEHHVVIRGKIRDQSELLGLLNTLCQYQAKILKVERLTSQ